MIRLKPQEWKGDCPRVYVRGVPFNMDEEHGMTARVEYIVQLYMDGRWWRANYGTNPTPSLEEARECIASAREGDVRGAYKRFRILKRTVTIEEIEQDE